MSLQEAKSTLAELADSLADWQGRLSALSERIPNPTFEPDTDRPLNAAARMVATIDSLLLEDMATMEQAARSAAGARRRSTRRTALRGNGDGG
jgi:hypothetical protein